MVRFQIASRDITDPRVLEAMRRVPRDRFVPGSSRAHAYGDYPISIGHGQTISQPYIVAFMTQALRLRSDARVLEVGTGSGYQAAVLAEICGEVYTVERIPELAASARVTLRELGYGNVFVLTGDGCEGWPEHAPYDGILVAAAASSIPQALREQLADGGRMVIPIGDWRATQVLVTALRAGKAITTEESIGCRFVPLLGKSAFGRY
jgi:protein-L-isoaspartate(D-aspartate) O-methyltransferase